MQSPEARPQACSSSFLLLCLDLNPFVFDPNGRTADLTLQRSSSGFGCSTVKFLLDMLRTGAGAA